MMPRPAAPSRALRALALMALALTLAVVPVRAQRTVSAAAMSAPFGAPLGRTGPGRAAARTSISVVRVSKWALLGATVGFGVYALRHTSRAQEHYDSLITACTTSPRRCDLADGRYVDAGIERLYQLTLEQDRRARVGIVGGQATLLGSVALFIVDLRNGRGPADIPYPGTDAAAAVAAPRVAAGLRLTF